MKRDKAQFSKHSCAQIGETHLRHSIESPGWRERGERPRQWRVYAAKKAGMNCSTVRTLLMRMSPAMVMIACSASASIVRLARHGYSRCSFGLLLHQARSRRRTCVYQESGFRRLVLVRRRGREEPRIVRRRTDHFKTGRTD